MSFFIYPVGDGNSEEVTITPTEKKGSYTISVKKYKTVDKEKKPISPEKTHPAPSTYNEVELTHPDETDAKVTTLRGKLEGSPQAGIIISVKCFNKPSGKDKAGQVTRPPAVSWKDITQAEQDEITKALKNRDEKPKEKPPEKDEKKEEKKEQKEKK
jgi:hypothetical protein